MSGSVALVRASAEGGLEYTPQTFPNPHPSAVLFFALESPIDHQALANAAVASAIRSNVPLSRSVSGFQAFLPPDLIQQRKRNDFVIPADGHRVLRLVTLSRRIPPAVEKHALDKRVQRFVDRVGRQPLQMELGTLRAEVVGNLLPDAPVIENQRLILVDRSGTRVGIEAATPTRAESVLAALRHIFGTFPATPMVCSPPIGVQMTQWLSGSPLPRGLALGARATLVGSGKEKAQLNHHDLTGDEVHEHLLARKQAKAVEVLWRSDFSCTLTAEHAVTSIKPSDRMRSTVKTERMSRADLEAVLAPCVSSLFDLAEVLFTGSAAATAAVDVELAAIASEHASQVLIGELS